jgi:hypothetical protein
VLKLLLAYGKAFEKDLAEQQAGGFCWESSATEEK